MRFVSNVFMVAAAITTVSCSVAGLTTPQYRESASPIVMLHGLGASRMQFEAFDADLQAAGCKSLVVDLPGFGAGPSLPDYTIEAMDAAVVDAVELSSPDGMPVTLVGNSMGGLLAMRYALAWPDRVEQLVLVAPAFWNDSGLGITGEKLARGADPRTVEDMTAYASRIWSDPSTVDVAKALADHRAVNSRGAIQGLAPTLASGEPGLSEDDLQSLDVDTLIVQGADDGIVSLEQSRKLADTLPGAKLVVMPDTGHWPQVESLAEFQARLSDVYDVSACSRS